MTTLSWPLRQIPLFLAFLFVLAACDSADVAAPDPDPVPTVGSVTVSPSDATLQKGETLAFEAEVRDEDGRVITTEIDWSVSDEAVVTIDDEGVAQGAGPGTAEITATAGGVSGAAEVVVDPPLDVTDMAIAFHSDRDGGVQDVWLMEADGANPVNLTKPFHGDAHFSPRWSPDGARIAFERRDDGDGGRGDIWVVNADRSYPLNLTDSPSTWNGHPAWSPDGTRIAFHEMTETTAHVWAINPDGSEPLRLSPSAPSGLGSGPGGWSPDGTRFAFGHEGHHEQNLWVVEADGSNPTALTDGPYADTLPWYGSSPWSPDGQRIAFSRNIWDGSSWGDADIWTIEADGSDPVNLTEDFAGSAGLPQWSPDGTQIAFTSGGDIWVMDADGSNLTALTHGGGPQWSPDGTQLAFHRDGDIWIMDADGSNQANLTNNPASNDRFPEWRPIP